MVGKGHYWADVVAQALAIGEGWMVDLVNVRSQPETASSSPTYAPLSVI